MMSQLYPEMAFEFAAAPGHCVAVVEPAAADPVDLLEPQLAPFDSLALFVAGEQIVEVWSSGLEIEKGGAVSAWKNHHSAQHHAWSLFP